MKCLSPAASLLIGFLLSSVSQIGAASPATLGEKLFFDERLSVDGTVACANCHVPSSAFSDGKPVAVGVRRKHGSRNTPSVLGVAGAQIFSWEGRRTSLRDQVLDPFTNPFEMGLRDTKHLEARLGEISEYLELFADAFRGSEGATITAERVALALAAYLETLPPANSAFSRFQRDPTRHPLDAQQQRGLEIFRGKAQCAECHSLGADPARDSQFHHSGIGWAQIQYDLPRLRREVDEAALEGSNLGARIAADRQWADLGRYVVTRDPKDIGVFRVPSLRNVAVTSPYMHDGSVATLDEAVRYEIYYRSLSTGKQLRLGVEEQAALVRFLESLTDD